jgi:hypothetical protein
VKNRRHIFIQKLIAAFLLAAVSLFVSPKELIHEFFHHEESMDITHADDCSGHLSAEHQHCDVLQLTTPPLFHHVINYSFSTPVLLFNLQVHIASSFHFVSSPFLFFRGPPSLV